MTPIDFAAFTAFPCGFETMSPDLERVWDHIALLFSIGFAPDHRPFGVITASIARSIECMCASIRTQDHTGISQ